MLELLEPELLDVTYSTPEARDGTLFVLGVQIDDADKGFRQNIRTQYSLK